MTERKQMGEKQADEFDSCRTTWINNNNLDQFKYLGRNFSISLVSLMAE